MSLRLGMIGGRLREFTITRHRINQDMFYYRVITWELLWKNSDEREDYIYRKSQDGGFYDFAHFCSQKSYSISYIFPPTR